VIKLVLRLSLPKIIYPNRIIQQVPANRHQVICTRLYKLFKIVGQNGINHELPDKCKQVCLAIRIGQNGLNKVLPSVIEFLLQVILSKSQGQNGMIHCVPAKCDQMTSTSMTI